MVSSAIWSPVEPLTMLAGQLQELKQNGPNALPTYVRNVRLKLLTKSKQVVTEAQL